jgi:rRNA maturation endonuclease Nob1
MDKTMKKRYSGFVWKNKCSECQATFMDKQPKIICDLCATKKKRDTLLKDILDT